jgi:ABC-type thiamin/hydroxymethylpyrimidine transport system permease subunit
VLKTRELVLIIILSALGGAISVPIGYVGNLLNELPIFPFGTPQLLSGIHILWLLLAGLLVKERGSATLTGAVKGLVELALFSFHGIQVLPISILEGAIIDIVLGGLGRDSSLNVAVAGGLSASSNVLVLWSLLLQSLPISVVFFMWLLSFISGLIVGYFGKYAPKRVALIWHPN